MVRAGVANHPSEWKWSVYQEIQEPKTRYRLLNHEEPRRLLEQETNEALAKTHIRSVEGQLIRSKGREDQWSRSIAVGSKIFIERVQVTLGHRALGRKAHKTYDDAYHLREAISKYGFPDSIRSGEETTIFSVDNLIPLGVERDL